jgi:hypothetical protein
MNTDLKRGDKIYIIDKSIGRPMIDVINNNRVPIQWEETNIRGEQESLPVGWFQRTTEYHHQTVYVVVYKDGIGGGDYYLSSDVISSIPKHLPEKLFEV